MSSNNNGGDGDGGVYMYFLVNMDLKMGAGKLAAQVAHGAIDAYLKAANAPGQCKFWDWKRSGNAKIVLKSTEAEMRSLADKYPHLACPIIDEGRTQIAAGSLTVVAWCPMSKGTIKEFDKLKLL